jgi:hypothetical protein
MLLLKQRKLIGVMFAAGLRAIAIADQRLHVNRLGELHRQGEAIAMNGCGGTVLHWSGRDDTEDADGSRAPLPGRSIPSTGSPRCGAAAAPALWPLICSRSNSLQGLSSAPDCFSTASAAAAVIDLGVAGAGTANLLSLDGRWLPCTIERQSGGPLWISGAENIAGGMSGSPILGDDGSAMVVHRDEDR